jgi:hypothetical protein
VSPWATTVVVGPAARRALAPLARIAAWHQTAGAGRTAAGGGRFRTAELAVVRVAVEVGL